MWNTYNNDVNEFPLIFRVHKYRPSAVVPTKYYKLLHIYWRNSLTSLPQYATVN